MQTVQNPSKIQDLLNVPQDSRDLDWEEKFFVHLTNMNVKVLSPEPQQGPDGWPYLLTEISEDAEEPVQKIMAWLAQRGIGLVVNPTKSYPDYVFNYGMLWHFRETGLFFKKQDQVPTGAVNWQEGQKLMAGQPTEKFLPGYVRKVLRDFFRDQNLLAVKILLISEDGEHFDLAFSLESLGNPPKTEHQGIAEAISWFMPPHYSIVLASEQGLPGFFEL